MEIIYSKFLGLLLISLYQFWAHTKTKNIAVSRHNLFLVNSLEILPHMSSNEKTLVTILVTGKDMSYRFHNPENYQGQRFSQTYRSHTHRSKGESLSLFTQPLT